MATTTIRVRRIGNSKGILFPKAILAKSGIKDSVSLTLKKGVIMIEAYKNKKKWSDFKKQKPNVDLVANTFDQNEWKW